MGNTRASNNRAPLRAHPAPATPEGYVRVSPPRWSRSTECWICELHYRTGAVCEIRYPDERAAWIDYDVRRERLRAADTSTNAHLRRRIQARKILRDYQRGLVEHLSPEERGILEAITAPAVLRRSRGRR